MKIIFIFIDGLGIGEADPGKNPLEAIETPGFDKLFKEALVYSTDASLGIPGLPQSATGQTAIFTGVNAASVLGRHMSGQPTITLRNLIKKGNLFRELAKRGLSYTNSNVYRDEYLELMHHPGERRHRPSVTSVMCLEEGLSFRTVRDYNGGLGIYHDITGRIIKESGYDTELITPQEAAGRLYKISRAHDFTLYEHFMSDIIGHKGDMEMAKAEIELLDAFLSELMELLDPEKEVLFITSDHGNLEDISVRTHTLNRVPAIIYGKLPGYVKGEISSLTDIMPFILGLFDRV